ncbi:5-(carboxyamino)imidazole ribonucleotide synthase [Ornithobacterium rhinotracheale]|uniref:5-(carboxyamino)imidazole ribonucleotide synthase n=1 Tax=Ornithobacterium rhinotracheale TaxID=28251 RepID=UPI004036421D
MKKIGILGGGQLGRMFIQNALNYPYEISILDPNPEAPCSKIAHRFVCGDFNDYQSVMDFAQQVDIVGIEIEHVNLEALRELKKQGKTVIPDPDVLEIIQDKGKQKDFYLKNNIPTAPLKEKTDFPVVQKLCTGGYDGKGVQILRDEETEIWEENSIFEALADLKMELAVIVAQNADGERAVYPVVEQVFNPKYNLLDYLITPARISPEEEEKAKQIALEVVKAFDSPGIYAVELFLNNDGSIWVNETAPRVHNSGHATIEAAYSSQFDMMLRTLVNLPLGNTDLKCKAAMLNLIGAPDHKGESSIKGLNDALKLPGFSIHWYGKKLTSPGRKMGHATFCGNNWDEIITQIEKVKKEVEIISVKLLKQIFPFLLTLLFLHKVSAQVKDNKVYITPIYEFDYQEDNRIKEIFKNHKLNGCITLFSDKEKIFYMNDIDEAEKRELPASTFKIPHTIIALELGIIKSPYETLKWNGEKRQLKEWERDLSIKEAFKLSCVPCYQNIAKKIGSKEMNKWLNKLRYGEMVINENNIDNFWLKGESRINSIEQIGFLEDFIHGRLPIKRRTRSDFLEIFKTKTTDSYKLYEKTGLTENNNHYIGWYVGFINTQNFEKIYFATRINANKKDINTDEKLKNFIDNRKIVTQKAIKEIFDIDLTK